MSRESPRWRSRPRTWSATSSWAASSRPTTGPPRAAATRRSESLTNTITAAIDLVVDSELWAQEPAAEATVRDAIAAAADLVRALPAAAAEVSVVLTDDAAIRALNRTWRKIDKPTNVLSFPSPA